LARTEADKQNGRILIADDDKDFRRLLASRAVRMGLKLDEADDGREALQLVRDQKYDVLVLDLYMPEATGLDVFQAAQDTDPDIQALVLTGSATLETALEALRVGVYDYLTKPLESMTVFELALTRALEHRYLVRENKRLFQEVQRLAVTDPLTQLYNRHKLDETLSLEIERAKRYGRSLSLIMMDVDDLKGVNDEFGHQVGDEVLKSIATAIRDVIRQVDLPVRYGGDEFVILLPEANFEEAFGVERRLHKRITEKVFKGQKITVSSGVVQWRGSFVSAANFVKAADEAMYRSKKEHN
jgi:two-component system cell cycle response regulator